MRVSVVVITYNRRDLVCETLDHLLAQTRPLDEIVVVDDGSTDGSPARLRDRYGDKIHLIEQANAGVEGARKRGIEAASGDWVALCDSDDRWHPDHLKRLCALAHVAPDAGFLFSNFDEFGPKAKEGDKFSRMHDSFWDGCGDLGDDFLLLPEDAFDRLLFQNPVFPTACMFRASDYQAVGGINRAFKDVRAADADLTRRLALQTRVAGDRRVTVSIRKNGENISADTLESAMGRITVLKDNLQTGGIFDARRSLIEKAIRDTAIEAMLSAFSARDMITFRKVAAELPFHDRTASLKIRSLIAALPGPLHRPLFYLYHMYGG